MMGEGIMCTIIVHESTQARPGGGTALPHLARPSRAALCARRSTFRPVSRLTVMACFTSRALYSESSLGEPELLPLSLSPAPEKLDFFRLVCYTLCSPQPHHSPGRSPSHREGVVLFCSAAHERGPPEAPCDAWVDDEGSDHLASAALRAAITRA